MIESPYSGDIEKNVEYAWKAMNHSYTVKGEAPVACHLLYTKLTGEYVSDDGPVVLRGRDHALKCCEAMRNSVDLTAFYVDLGWSSGMLRALEELPEGSPYVTRKILKTGENAKVTLTDNASSGPTESEEKENNEKKRKLEESTL